MIRVRPVCVRFLCVISRYASHGNSRLLDACFRVFARYVKKKFSTLSLRSVIENGSF